MSAGRLGNDVQRLDPEAVRALSELLGDPEALTELVDAFVDEAPKRLAELRLGADQGDAALAGRAAHTLKSNGLTFGAVELAELCRRLEVAAAAGELAGSRPLVERVEDEWTRVREALSVLRDGGPR
jgi:HPt (histidine-containing phosphotransfer) domain-containing protein